LKVAKIMPPQWALDGAQRLHDAAMAELQSKVRRPFELGDTASFDAIEECAEDMARCMRSVAALPTHTAEQAQQHALDVANYVLAGWLLLRDAPNARVYTSAVWCVTVCNAAKPEVLTSGYVSGMAMNLIARMHAARMSGDVDAALVKFGAAPTVRA
jgi:hypothetical protein